MSYPSGLDEKIPLRTHEQVTRKIKAQAKLWKWTELLWDKPLVFVHYLFRFSIYSYLNWRENIYYLKVKMANCCFPTSFFFQLKWFISTKISFDFLLFFFHIISGKTFTPNFIFEKVLLCLLQKDQNHSSLSKEVEKVGMGIFTTAQTIRFVGIFLPYWKRKKNNLFTAKMHYINIWM